MASFASGVASIDPTSAPNPFLVGLDGTGESDAASVSGFPQTWSETPAGNAVPVIATPGVNIGSWANLISSGISTGLSAWRTSLQAGLLQSQINHGQTPSIVTGPNGTPSAPFSITTPAGTFSAGSSVAALSSGSLLIYIFLAVVLVLLFRK